MIQNIKLYLLENNTGQIPGVKENPRDLTGDGFAKAKQSIKDFPEMLEVRTLVVVKHGEMFVVIGGNQRLRAMRDLDYDNAPVMVVDWTVDKINEFIIKDNIEYGVWNFELLANEWDVPQLVDWGMNLPEAFTEEATEEDEDGANVDTGVKGSLSERFGVPPFTVLNAREGWWQDRKRAWTSIGIESDKGRDAECLSTSGIGENYGRKETTGVSIFDPVLCELMVEWFSAKNDLILDCFAGGSVRGIVSASKGRNYVGVDLSSKQVEENRRQGEAICDEIMPVWINGDSIEIQSLTNNVAADMIMSCPPYADLEVYSDKPNDISNMNYADFKIAYAKIIKNTCALLREDRFACFVIGEIRDKKGIYQNFVGDTIQAFLDAGMKYYNEAILVTAIGTLPIRATKTFNAGRKLGKTHQNVLIFVKGDPKKATERLGSCEFGEIEEPAESQAE